MVALVLQTEKPFVFIPSVPHLLALTLFTMFILSKHNNNYKKANKFGRP